MREREEKLACTATLTRSFDWTLGLSSSSSSLYRPACYADNDGTALNKSRFVRMDAGPPLLQRLLGADLVYIFLG